MSCNYFKISLFSILLCILIITHKFSLKQISHNKTNTVDIKNAVYKRLLTESHETDILRTHSDGNLLTHPINNTSHENATEYHETSPDCALSDEFLQNSFNQTEKKEWKNEKNNKSLLQKKHKKKNCKNIKIIFLITLLFFIL
ncbi:Plasmodium exported protein (hyp10), unknown, putative [Plasmodium sp. DRC-Itaito]|nr:Plasmodium exported protein (hyp10), unknown, putative [Plasmodium sp. DRC-Itaito]